jgi:hypothetical protein
MPVILDPADWVGRHEADAPGYGVCRNGVI